ncbi:transcriptional regulator [Photorhabdus luminescens]|uniref:XRE family transcriptional regulator n=3 Tax=Photorhabdus TaxID=29487 RepID=A0A2S8Q878_9GAMM|nr:MULTISPECIES: helix-turn-helix transcriptional regulator [Photorhabdus]EYU14651.1 putative transcriptional regulator [Photorhabdus aegyptia]PQQ29118.1 XRE family transcriptional regulator [Photorhabdus hindustanensis]QXF35961.1 transcriptional regulator [Photorhabdus akhurstii]UJD77797.1 transcriptional regulator [Photorhabdus luminescens]
MINKRLKAARLRANITQEKLGIAAGIDEKSARARVSQYENGTHQPTFETMCAFSKVLNVPECYFYIVDDDFSDVVLAIHQILVNHRDVPEN